MESKRSTLPPLMLRQCQSRNFMSFFMWVLVITVHYTLGLSNRCLLNCAKKANAFEKIVLIAQIRNDLPSFYNMPWQIQFPVRSKTFNWEKSVCTKRISKMLCIKPNVFSEYDEIIFSFKGTKNTNS